MSPRNRRIQELWLDGMSMDEIAAELNSTKASIGVSMQRLRARGVDLPYRKVPFDPRYPDQAEPETLGFYRCGGCGEEKPHIAFPFPIRSRVCFECRAKRSRARGRFGTARKASLLKRQARTCLAEAVRSGRIVKPNACQRCGEVCDEKGPSGIHGHHPDYGQPLEVLWLCPRCHRAEHVRLKFIQQEKDAADVEIPAPTTPMEVPHERFVQ